MANPINWLTPVRPFPNESLASFLGRFARENYVDSRRALLQELELSHAIRVAAADLPRLGQLLGVTSDELKQIAPSDSPSIPALRRSLTRTRFDAVCPQCLQSNSYSRRLWSHALATACPDHGVHLIDVCPACGDPLRHDRPLPHLCDCGYDLRDYAPTPAQPHEVDIAQLLEGRMPQACFLPLDLASGVPADIDLFILGLANHFAPTNTSAPGARPGKAAMPRSVESARERLKEIFQLTHPWPSAIEARVEELMKVAPREATVSVSRRLGPWYGFLFRRFRHDAYAPLRQVVADCIVRAHDSPIDARTRNLQALATVRKEWLTLAEAARELGVRSERLADGIDDGRIQAIVRDEAAGYRQQFISRAEVDRLAGVRASHIDESSAARLLSVPASVLSVMKDAGLVLAVDAAQVAPVINGRIDAAHLQKLANQLLARAPKMVSGDRARYVALRDLNLRRTTDRQRLIDLFVDIGDGSFMPAGHDGSGVVGGLLFTKGSVQTRIASFAVQVQLNVQQISELTGAHYDAVKSWIDSGLLPASRSTDLQGQPWLVELSDLVQFLLHFSPLASLAKQVNSSSRGLAAALARRGLQTAAGDQQRGAVVRLSDLVELGQKPPQIAAPACRASLDPSSTLDHAEQYPTDD